MAHVESQEDSSFPTDGHHVIQTKMNKKSKTNKTQTDIDNSNTPQQKHRLETVKNKLGVGA